MAQAALRNGHDVTMVCGSYTGGHTGLTDPYLRGRRQGMVDGIKVIEFDLSYSNKDGFLKRAGTFLKFAWGSMKLALREPYDVAFATTTPLTAGLPGLVARWLRRKPFVFEVRDLWPELPRAMGVIKNPVILWAMSVLEFMSYRSAHRCIGLSPGIVQGITHRGVAPEKITMVPNGCDLKIFDQNNTAAWRPDGVADTDLMAVFTGTHGQANGLDAVLNTAAELQNRGRSDIKFVLIGDGKLKPALKQRAQDENLKNVIFLAPVPKAKLSELMVGADLGLQCLANIPAFYYGTSPNKFFDYIAAGLPVLNNYPGWLADMITEHHCGFVVPPDDHICFADTLELAAKNRADLPAKGQNARALAKAEFDRTQLSQTWVDWVTAGKRHDT